MGPRPPDPLPCEPSVWPCLPARPAPPASLAPIGAQPALGPRHLRLGPRSRLLRPSVRPPDRGTPAPYVAPAPTSPRGHAHGAENMALAPSGGRAAYTASAAFSYVLAVFDVNDLSKQPSCESGTSSRIREGRRSRAPSFIAQLIMF